ncbi:major facilitator superfamily domain-containing protein [Phascolomyces articulosus]|uniref:Major facilitator superfamily domain-containing protein n=1 Tax=Phascolomyces articulosus TaxID=60185 RepID=A0AAD5JQU0_9FUNG|nr:major facilitator superfamily domain-containing protein [Phascolomyces articulosus]
MVDDSAGDITGSLSFYSEFISMVAVVCWGVSSDYLEKRTINSISFVIMGIIVIAYPYAKNVYPTLLLLRFIYSVGTAGTTCMMAGILLEIVPGERSGLASGLIGTASGLGAIFAAFVLFSVPTRMAHLAESQFDPILINYGYAVIGAVTIAIGVILWFVMPKNKRHISSITAEKPNLIAASTWKKRSVEVVDNLKHGVLAAKDPRIALGYVSSFFARADEVIITHFISLWVQQYYIDIGRCQVGAYCPYASSSTQTMTGIAQSVALVVAPFFGIGSHFSKEWSLIIAGCIGVSGCIPFAFSINPTANTSLAFVILLAMGEYGMIVAGLALLARDKVRPEYRGGVAGVYSLCGCIGIMIVSKVGGVLFDKWMKGAPFLLLGIGHALVALLALIHFIYLMVKKYVYGQKDIKVFS